MKKILITFLSGGNFQEKLEDLGKLSIRLFFGLSLVINHGCPTFYGFFAGSPDFPDPLGLGSEISRLLAGGAEFIFGILIVIGFCTRISVIPILINFCIAFFIFHSDDPFGRKEMAYLYLSSMAAIFLLGSGRLSIDYWLFGISEKFKKEKPPQDNTTKG